MVHTPEHRRSCLIHYGVRGYALGHMEVPGYGNLRALELDQKGRMSANENGRDAPDSLSHLLGC